MRDLSEESPSLRHHSQESRWWRDVAAFTTTVTTVTVTTHHHRWPPEPEAVLWVIPSTGYGDDFVAALEGIAGGNPHVVTLLFGLIFPLVHSGLASLRAYGEPLVGARAWRVLFAWCSLPLAYSWIVYFIGHIHEGIVLWDGEACLACGAGEVWGGS